VLIVHSDDGLDEISIAAPTSVVELHNGVITEYQITPEQFGFERTALSELKVADAAESLQLIKRLLSGEDCAAANIVALNAGAALYAADVASSLEAGIVLAKKTLASGEGAAKMEALASYSSSL
jgi:anthranilate phosphoribosyltransferase